MAGWMDGISYHSLVNATPILRAFGNSVELTLVGVVLSMIGTITLAYPLSKSYFYGRRFWSMAIVFTMLFGGGLIPNFLLIKSLGLTNSYWSIWLPGLISTYNMWVMRTFFQNIPGELEDAARIDGCGETSLLLRIILPTSLPMLVTIGLFYGVGIWNNFFSVLIYITDTSKMNLAVMIQQMIFATTDPTSLLDPNLT